MPWAATPPFSTSLPAPTGPLPPDAVTNGPLTNVSLSWNPGCGAALYDVHFGTTTPPPLTASDVMATSYSVGNLTAGQIYYWKVVSKNVYTDSSGTSPIWTFTPAPSGSLPDLTVTSLTLTGGTSARVGGSLGLSSVVANQGVSTGTTFTFGFFFLRVISDRTKFGF